MNRYSANCRTYWKSGGLTSETFTNSTLKGLKEVMDMVIRKYSDAAEAIIFDPIKKITTVPLKGKGKYVQFCPIKNHYLKHAPSEETHKKIDLTSEKLSATVTSH